MDQEGFQHALKPIRVRVSPVQITLTANGFTALDAQNYDKGESSQQGQQVMETGAEGMEGGNCLLSNG